MRRSFNLGCGFGLVVLLIVGMACPLQGAQKVTIWGGEPTRHAVALTFDDGPSPRYTPQILALLKQYQARATFFVLGCHVEKYPQVIKAILQDGHEVGNHSFDHPRLTKCNQPVREQELERTAMDLDLLGCSAKKCRLFRPPYSAYDDRLKSYLAHTQRHLALWNIDSGDWQGLDAATIVSNVLNRVHNGAIIIFHDSCEKNRTSRQATVAALRVILPALQAAGYRMVTVSELIDHANN